MLIIGLNAYHPYSSACALTDGKLVAAVAEERLGKRVKHAEGFPGNALREVLRMAGATIRDVAEPDVLRFDCGICEKEPCAGGFEHEFQRE